MQRPAAWILLVLLSAASAAVAWIYFPQAFSILSIDIAMDRGAALAGARDLGARHELGPSDYRQAASFSLDSETQTFVELEGGGKPAFTAMLQEGLYAAYAWRVRHFQPGETREVTFRFRPDGQPYGFVERLAEDQPGAALDAEAARDIAESRAVADWYVDLQPYALVEQAQEVRPGGRVDHSFTYERAAPTLGEGRYRLRLAVAGDRLTEVTHFVRIPEAFTRRYAGMRSANDTIGAAAAFSMVLLYGVGGIGVGLFFMMRRRWVIWRPAIKWAMVVAALQTLAIVNDWPLQWMGYDTALPYSTYLIQQAALLAATFFGFTTLFGLSFVAAETLTRRAFGSHPQFWRLWGRGAGSSTAVLGRTAAGYLLVTVFLAYDVLLYLFATRRLGWWLPAESLVHPDVLASYVPWLGAVALSLQAGFWEECMFRAIPIAGAALIGDRFGRRGLFIAVAFVIQAVVFGAGHAPYPAQPAFARPVELILPSIGFGLLYLWFGLLPAIVLHFAFDVVWFALPLFTSSAPGVWVQQVMVVVVTLVPLWVVFLRRAQAGRWTTIEAPLTNAAWTPPPPEEAAEPERVRPARPLPAAAGVMWMALGAIGLIGVVVVSLVRPAPAGLPIGRDDAETLARQALAARGADLGPPWRVMLMPENGADVGHAFVADTAGEARRQALIGRYLSRPRWRVRVARFEGDVAERAEEWRVFVWSADEVGFVQHLLPESRPGASLDEEAARELALEAVRRERGLGAAELREVSARPTRLAERTDWLFTFADTTVEPLPQGEPRISVRIAGDEVTAVGPFVFIPDDWQRDRRAAETLATVLQVGAAALFGILLVTVAALGVRAWSRGAYAARVFFLTTAIVLVASGIGAINSWPALESAMSTAQPYRLQAIALAGAALVAAVVMAAIHGLATGYLPHRLPAGRLRDVEAARLGIAGGLAAAGALAIARWLQTPAWAAVPDLTALGSSLPMLQLTLAPVVALITRTAIVLGVLLFVDGMTLGWSERRGRGAAVLAVVGFLGVASPAAGSGTGWVLAGLVGAAALTAFYATLARADLSMVPIALAAVVVVESLRLAVSAPFSGATAGAIGGGVVAAATGWWLFSALRRTRR